MMPRKKKRVLIIISILIILIAIVAVIAFLYMTTDMFKPASTLFAKYIGQNVENINSMFEGNQSDLTGESTDKGKYTSKTEIEAKLIKNVGTTAENTDNSINQVKLKIDGKTDKENNYNHQDISLLQGNDKKAEIEYIEEEDVYGLRFNDLFEQFILTNKEDLSKNIEQLKNLPEGIDIKAKLKEIFTFSDEEKQTIATKYSGIINSNVSKDKFSTQKNQKVEINGRNIITNCYVLTLTNEQLNGINIKILEALKEEEIILSRIKKIQELVPTDESNNEDSEAIKAEYNEKIDKIIENINDNNIGQEETKIMVYESNQTTVKTTIQGINYEINFEILPNEYMQFSITNSEKGDNTKIVTYKKENEKTSIEFEMQENEKTKKYSINMSKTSEEKTADKKIDLTYEDESNKFEINIEQENETVEELEDKIKLNNKNSINLSKLEDDQKQNVMNELMTALSGELNGIMTNVIKTEDVLDILRVIGVMDEEITIEGGQVTDAQRNRFNSKFEMLQATEIEEEKAKELIDSIKDNLNGYEVLSKTEIKLKIDRNSENAEDEKAIKAFIEENGNIKYNVSVEYDETTGLVNGLILTLKEE